MRIAGPWSVAQVEGHLRDTIVPLRLACTTPSGHPLLLSLWFLWREGAIWCATSPRARVVSLLRRDPRCSFEVARDAPPYRGVRGSGRAEILPARGGEILAALVDRYLGTRESRFARWLLRRSGAEVAIRIAPARFASWDFTERMSA
jgi:nitroimidazol reductase NimA-like FMN-containing flavoprotein (pyridoxamine 5'-phosphate oxidase superfamily)